MSGATTFSWRFPAALALAAGLSCAGVAGAQEAQDGGWKYELRPEWEVSGNLSKDKDMSAAAAFSPERALVASDETRAVQSVRLDPASRQVIVGSAVPLWPGAGTELDIEGIAASETERAYFITGSHALSRKKKTFEASRGYVFKLPVDEHNNPKADAIEKVNFHAVLKKDEVLAPFLNVAAEDNGLDIEALAERGGRLFFGLRAPSRGGKSFIVEIGAGELFGGQTKVIRHEVALGAGRGIREMATLPDGSFLLIVGSSGTSEDEHATAKGFALWSWDGPSSAPRKISDMGLLPGKAEGMAIYEATDSVVKGVLFFDGAKNGAPTGFQLRRTSQP